MQSLKRLIPENKKVLVFGDTNANPDIEYEKCVKKKEAFLNNCIFEWFMNDLGLVEVYPLGEIEKTTKYNTRIDRVFTNMSKVNLEIDNLFLDLGISDHAALKIEFEDE